MKRSLTKPLGTAAGLLAVCVLLFSMPTLLNSEYWTHVLVLSTIYVIMAVSLRCLARVGQISMGSAGFMLVGAYASSILSMRWGINVWLSILLGAFLAQHWPDMAGALVRRRPRGTLGRAAAGGHVAVAVAVAVITQPP